GNYVDSIPPTLVRVTVIDNATLQLIFSESLDSISAANISNYFIQPNTAIISVQVISPDLMNVNLQIDPALDTNTVYTIIANNLADCHGNIMTIVDSAKVAIPSIINIGDILINEILFNPKTGGYDYLEIYNNTDKIFDLKDLKVSSADDFDSLTSINEITSESFLLFPDQYVVLTENSDWVKQNYVAQNPDWLLGITNLPSYNDDEGRVVLLNNLNERIDEFHYNASWHFPLIDDVEGVSLERIDPNQATQDSMNWHSAASTVGYGTPTYKNSQYSEASFGNEITLSPQVFSPDNDGYNDVLNISYQFDKAGYTANVKIFDAEGRETINLIRNLLLAQTGNFTWDGVTNDGEKARVGTYIIYTQVFDLNGKVKHYKKVCVVAAKKS
ncbi:MAG: lamin tail domain-containing protein, partial [Chitinophagales bacterium]|nr:lamin tail domain-containing protein [Chitinophagales bacterium]